jgi:cell division initiation protein
MLVEAQLDLLKSDDWDTLMEFELDATEFDLEEDAIK